VSDPATIDPAPPAAAPLPVLALEYAPPPQTGSRVWRWILTICLPAAYAVCVLAVVLIAAVHVESVLFTGPALSATGLLTVIAGVFKRDRVASFVGTCHCAICLLFVGLVNALHWSPRDARTPFLLMGIAYTILMLLPTYLACVPYIGRRRGTAP
jgi:hypothetical protein